MSTMKELPIKDSLYYEKQFLAAQSAWGGSLYEDAVRIFSDLKGKGYQENKVYQSICEIYKNDINDTTSYFNTLLEGNNKFPQEFYYLGNIINHFMFSGQSQEAIKYLDMAIKENPNDAQLYNAYSSILEQQKDIEGAKKYIDQALVLDPNFADAWSTKGRLIYNQAFYKEQESFNASGKELKLLEEEFIKLYEESIPYFQKAIELNPNDFESMKTLKSLYYKLSSQFHINKYDELYNQMQERLNNF